MALALDKHFGGGSALHEAVIRNEIAVSRPEYNTNSKSMATAFDGITGLGAATKIFGLHANAHGKVSVPPPPAVKKVGKNPGKKSGTKRSLGNGAVKRKRRKLKLRHAAASGRATSGNVASTPKKKIKKKNRKFQEFSEEFPEELDV